jgi:DNA-binding response OmpR family regulator
MCNVLVVCHQPGLLDLVKRQYPAQTCHLHHADDGLTAISALVNGCFDLLIVGPQVIASGGWEVFKVLWTMVHVPVMVLPGDLTDAVAGAEAMPPLTCLRSGENAAPSAALHAQILPQTVTVGPLQVDRLRARVLLEGRELVVSPRELRLLDCLLRTEGQVMTREQIIAAVWGEGFAGSDRIVDVCLSRLRRQVLNRPGCPVTVRSVFGVGYRLCLVAVGSQGALTSAAC